MTARPAESQSQATRIRAGARAAGYCGLVHPDGSASCTRPPHSDRDHVDYYNGRPSLAAVSGTRWTE
ncbi:hypothetical protein [Streptomyces sp. NPDC057253]|uniref:hypothetical protein n=1 Tax=Streptomyces sp. NPDC057253 TaxID=3346069 RepID=UPI003638CDD5